MARRTTCLHISLFSPPSATSDHLRALPDTSYHLSLFLTASHPFLPPHTTNTISCRCIARITISLHFLRRPFAHFSFIRVLTTSSHLLAASYNFTLLDTLSYRGHSGSRVCGRLGTKGSGRSRPPTAPRQVMFWLLCWSRASQRGERVWVRGENDRPVGGVHGNLIVVLLINWLEMLLWRFVTGTCGN